MAMIVNKKEECALFELHTAYKITYLDLRYKKEKKLIDYIIAPNFDIAYNWAVENIETYNKEGELNEVYLKGIKEIFMSQLIVNEADKIDWE